MTHYPKLPGNPWGMDPDAAGTPDGRTNTSATLAVAYEQRTANMLAYLAIAEARGARDKATSDLDQIVRERLGLAEATND